MCHCYKTQAFSNNLQVILCTMWIHFCCVTQNQNSREERHEYGQRNWKQSQFSVSKQELTVKHKLENIRLIRDYWCLWLFLMFANTGLNVTSQHHDTNTCLYVTSQCHDVLLTLIAILCDSLCSNFGFPRTGLVEYIGVHRHQSIRKYNDLLIWKSPITLHAILLFHIYSFLLVYLCINL